MRVNETEYCTPEKSSDIVNMIEDNVYYTLCFWSVKSQLILEKVLGFNILCCFPHFESGWKFSQK